VNAKARINVPFGRSLTQVATLPPEAQHDRLGDPYADEKSAWPKIIVFAIVPGLRLLHSQQNGLHL